LAGGRRRRDATFADLGEARFWKPERWGDDRECGDRVLVVVEDDRGDTMNALEPFGVIGGETVVSRLA
jgi:hypothetical protein